MKTLNKISIFLIGIFIGIITTVAFDYFSGVKIEGIKTHDFRELQNKVIRLEELDFRLKKIESVIDSSFDMYGEDLYEIRYIQDLFVEPMLKSFKEIGYEIILVMKEPERRDDAEFFRLLFKKPLSNQ
jgi:hypothetical protein